jgi:hypothetical protein
MKVGYYEDFGVNMELLATSGFRLTVVENPNLSWND